jgi:hypothetical protein
MPEKAQDDKTTLLRSSSLPFSVLGVGDLLALFRCVSVRYVFSTDASQPHLMGAVGRVYTSQQPEMSNDLQQSDKRLYLRATEAQRCRVNATLLVPIFDPALSRKPVAVFELSQNDKNCPFNDMIHNLDRCLQALQLHSHTILTSSGGLYSNANPGWAIPLPGSWHEPKLLEGSPETSGECGALNSSNGFLVRDLLPGSAENAARGSIGLGQPSGAGFDIARRSMDGMRFQIPMPPPPVSSSMNMGGPQQQQGLVRPPMTQQPGPSLGIRAPFQGGLSASLAHCDPTTSWKPHMAPPPLVPINSAPMQAGARGQDTETSQQAKQLMEWMAANNVSTDALKTILLSKSPTDNQSKKKRVHESEAAISFQSLMMAQAAVDSGSGSGSKPLSAHQGHKSGPITQLPTQSLIPEAIAPAVNPLQRQSLGGRSDGFEHDELGSIDGDDDEEDDDDEAVKGVGGGGGGGEGGQKIIHQGARLTYDDLRGQFGKGIKDAAKALGICTTTLKRACRRHGITRWPRRQIAKLNKALAQIGYQGDTSAELLETAVKGKAGTSSKPAAKPKSSTAVTQADFFRPLSMTAPAPASLQSSDRALHNLLMMQAQRNQAMPLFGHQQSEPGLNYSLDHFLSSAEGSSGQQQQQQQIWGYSHGYSAPTSHLHPSQANYAPEQGQVASEGKPQTSTDMLNLAMDIFSGADYEGSDISLGSLLNEDDMKGIAFN